VKSEYEDSSEDYNLEEELENKKSLLHNVDWKEIAQEFSSILDENVKVFIGKSAVYLLKDLLLSEDGFDMENDEGDNNIVDKVYRSIFDNFDEFAQTSVSLETEKLINEIVKEILK